MIQFCPIKLSSDYATKWNEHSTDFFHLCDESGNKINDTLYRKGGYGGTLSEGYCILIKHVEAIYPDDITKDHKKKRHLEGIWCVIDESGNEVMVAPARFEYIYHIGGVVFSSNQKFYNILNGDCYGSTLTSIVTNEYIFMELSYSPNNPERGCKKINRKTGEVEFFPKSR